VISFCGMLNLRGQSPSDHPGFQQIALVDTETGELGCHRFLILLALDYAAGESDAEATARSRSKSWNCRIVAATAARLALTPTDPPPRSLAEGTLDLPSPTLNFKGSLQEKSSKIVW
jgi:hypothetical protein